MKKIFLAALWVSLFSVPVGAESVYISDVMQITLRTGPGTDHRVISMLQSGQEVDILNREGEWTQVRHSGGKEGWVLSRLLAPDKPRTLLLDQITEKNQALTQQVSNLTDKNKNLAGENQRLADETAKLQAKLGEIERSYARLQRESSEFLAVESRYQQSARNLNTQVQKANELEQSLKKLKSDQKMKWFLAGAGVLLLGFLIGLSAKRQRNRYL